MDRQLHMNIQMEDFCLETGLFQAPFDGLYRFSFYGRGEAALLELKVEENTISEINSEQDGVLHLDAQVQMSKGEFGGLFLASGAVYNGNQNCSLAVFHLE